MEQKNKNECNENINNFNNALIAISKSNRGETLFGKLFPPAMFWFSLISVVYPSSFFQVLTLAFLHDTHEAPIRASKL